MNEVVKTVIKYTLVLADGTRIDVSDHRSPMEKKADHIPGTYVEKWIYQLPKRGGKGKVTKRKLSA